MNSFLFPKQKLVFNFYKIYTFNGILRTKKKEKEKLLQVLLYNFASKVFRTRQILGLNPKKQQQIPNWAIWAQFSGHLIWHKVEPFKPKLHQLMAVWLCIKKQSFELTEMKSNTLKMINA